MVEYVKCYYENELQCNVLEVVQDHFSFALSAHANELRHTISPLTALTLRLHGLKSFHDVINDFGIIH